MKIYLASPLFNEEEISYIEKAEKILRGRGLEVFSPREHENREYGMGTREWYEAVFQIDYQAIKSSDVMVMLYHGNYSDSGTAWECGYAYGIGVPCVVVQIGDNSNLMVHEGSTSNITFDQLETYDFDNLPKYPYVFKGGEVF